MYNNIVRLFTAIDVSAEVKDRLRAVFHRVQVDKLHVTTKFIGEWPEARLGELKDALSGVSGIGAIDVSVRGLGRFRQILWAGVDGGEKLKALAKATELAVAEVGVPIEDREYTPHVTLARTKERVRAETEDFGSFRAHSFFLYLSARGKYTKLAEFKT